MAVAGRVTGAVPSPQLTTTEPPPVVKSATVANGLAEVNVAISTEPVLLPSMPVTEMLPEEVSGASTTVAVPAGCSE